MNAVDLMGMKALEQLPAAGYPAGGTSVPVTKVKASRVFGAGTRSVIEVLRASQIRAGENRTMTPTERASRGTAHLAPHVTFSVDQQKDQVVVLMLDPVTREVVRQIPPEEFLDIQRRLDDYVGKLADEAA